MRRFTLGLLATSLAIGMGGCFGGGEPVAESPVPESPVATSPDPAVSPTDQAFPSPTVAGQPPNGTAPNVVRVPSLPPDLIGSTDPDQRVRAVQSQRSDPFALVSAVPTVTIAEGATPVGATGGGTAAPAAPPTVTVNAGGGSPSPNNARTIPTGRSAAPSQPAASRPGSLAPVPNLTGGRNATPVPPPPPQPDLARAVKVTGVVQVGSTPYAIVSAPNEPTSRYVRVGQQLSNGQVSVKRIVMNAGAEPVVVLEQFGVEVEKLVGEGGASPVS